MRRNRLKTGFWDGKFIFFVSPHTHRRQFFLTFSHPVIRITRVVGWLWCSLDQVKVETVNINEICSKNGKK